ncbi:MAG TPA: hypothetical protein VFX61_10475 [Micromonosporaceae bacterium]|nr:hypothetical protein [Micromonosporaceae bacterium]
MGNKRQEIRGTAQGETDPRRRVERAMAEHATAERAADTAENRRIATEQAGRAAAAEPRPQARPGVAEPMTRARPALPEVSG